MDMSDDFDIVSKFEFKNTKIIDTNRRKDLAIHFKRTCKYMKYTFDLEPGEVRNKASLSDNITRIMNRISTLNKRKKQIRKELYENNDPNLVLELLEEWSKCVESIRKNRIFRAELEYLRDTL